jgi:15-cis-phytoene synthase
MTQPALEVERAYRLCEQITRREAANFYYGIRLLPRDKRQAMSAVYAFARRVDDIGDGDLPHREQLTALDEQRELIASVQECRVDHRDPVAIALSNANQHYLLPIDALEVLIDGVQADVVGTHYRTFEELVVYCRQVAGSVGRLCLAIFADGHRPDAGIAAQLADDLGVAMQLTNIVRDLREDHDRGRVYVPADDLHRFGCRDLMSSDTRTVAELIRYETTRAVRWFERGLGLVALLDPRSASCVLAMTGIYRGVLERIAREPAEVLRRRVSLPTYEKAWLALCSVAAARPPGATA